MSQDSGSANTNLPTSWEHRLMTSLRDSWYNGLRQSEGGDGLGWDRSKGTGQQRKVSTLIIKVSSCKEEEQQTEQGAVNREDRQNGK